MNDEHLVLCSGYRCSLDDCLCDCHLPGPHWVWAKADRAAYLATRIVLLFAAIYLVAVILATVWTTR